MTHMGFFFPSKGTQRENNDANLWLTKKKGTWTTEKQRNGGKGTKKDGTN